MDKFKEVKSWIGDDGYIHLGIKLSAVDANGQEWEMDIPDVTLLLDYKGLCVTRAQERGFDDSVREEPCYLKLRSDKLILNPQQGEAYIMRMIPKKMTKEEIEKELGYTVEIVPAEKGINWCASCIHREKAIRELPCTFCYKDPQKPSYKPRWSE